jgi:peptidoglycan hydrolase-like protein with peptidoglycan-binding domain
MRRIIVLIIAILFPGLVSAATLSISPSSQNINVGDTFSVSVVLDTQNQFTDGVDIVYLNYNPSLLQVQDASTTITGVQITPGDLLSYTVANTVNVDLGRVTFSQLAMGSSNYRGIGTLASISFKALAVGNANVSFNYTAGSTIDSNVAIGGLDILNGVSNGSFNIVTPAPAPPPVTSSPPSGGGGSTSGGSGTTGSGGGSTVTTVSGITGSGTTTNQMITIAVNISRWLTVGSTGADVLQLQQALNQNGYIIATTGTSSPGKETTYFDNLTAVAVGRFQCAKLQVCQGNPTTTGYGATGPRTRVALSQLKISIPVVNTNTSICPVGLICIPNSTLGTSTTLMDNIGAFSRSLTLGSTGADVKNLQIFLNSKGYTVSITGAGSPNNETMYFGPATQRAVIKFQIANNITPAVGYFGPITRNKVNGMK